MQIELRFEIEDDYGDGFVVECTAECDGLAGSNSADNDLDYGDYFEVLEVVYTLFQSKSQPLTNWDFRFVPKELQEKIGSEVFNKAYDAVHKNGGNDEL